MEAIEAAIAERFKKGDAPSDIDAELHLARGTAHDVIVHHWAVDKDSYHHRANMGGADAEFGA